MMLSGCWKAVKLVPPVRQITSSCLMFLDQNWRQAKGLPDNPNRETVLRDLPDYSFLDGRPTPYGARQRLRILKQREYTAKIIELTKEMDYSVDHHAAMLKEKEEAIQKALTKRLKKKGEKELKL